MNFEPQKATSGPASGKAHLVTVKPVVLLLLPVQSK